MSVIYYAFVAMSAIEPKIPTLLDDFYRNESPM